MKPKSAYSQKLLDPRWQKKRLEILERDGWACQVCFDTTHTLHVHHRKYMPNREPWDIDNRLLVTLCADCHEYETAEMNNVLDDLGAILKEKFLTGDIHNIAQGFLNLEPYHCAEVFSSVIKHWFSDPEKCKEMYDRYFDDISKNMKEPF